MKRIEFACNRMIPKEAMRCIACGRPLPLSASAVCVYAEDRWTVWHHPCFVRSWQQTAETPAS
jgi:hypothetical protein